MTACFVRPTPQQLWAQLTAMFSENVLGGAPIIPETNEYFLVGNDLAAMELFYSLAAQQYAQTQDATACCEALMNNNAPLGLFPYGATFSSGFAAVSGPFGSAIPTNLQMQIGSNTYNLSTAQNANPANLDGTGNAILLFNSLVPGAAVGASTNLAISQLGTLAGVSATLTIVPLGWQSNVIPQGNFQSGNDPEMCEQFRTRVIARKQFPPNTDFAYIQRVAQLYPCVTRVLQRTCGDCCNDGQLQLYAFMDNSFPYGVVPASVLPGLNAYLFGSPQGMGLGQAPCGLFGNVFPVGTVPININFFGMTGVTSAQFTQIQNLINGLFATLTPGQLIDSKWITAIVTSVNSNTGNYILQMTPQGTPDFVTIDCFGDVIPVCDILPIVGSINYTNALPPR